MAVWSGEEVVCWVGGRDAGSSMKIIMVEKKINLVPCSDGVDLGPGYGNDSEAKVNSK